MTRIRGVSGGGPQGQFVSETRAPKREPINHNISQNRPSQIGMSVHYHKTDLYESSTTPKGPTNLMTAGPGSGRMVLPSGSQAKTPKVTPPSKSKPFF